MDVISIKMCHMLMIVKSKNIFEHFSDVLFELS